MSKSAEASSTWQARADIFSGRSAPAWTLTSEQAVRLLSVWDKLDKGMGLRSTEGALGYRGLYLDDSSGRTWHARGHVVALISSRSRDTRWDPTREFERELLASAPEGLLPAGLLEGI